MSNPLLKAIKYNIDETFLAPLKNKINNNVNDFDESLETIKKDYDKPAYNITNEQSYYKQISDFIAKQLANSSNLEKINIHPRNITTNPGLYDPDTKTMDIYTFKQPFKTFIHEGTHVLDNNPNPLNRTYQKEAIDFLAKYMKDKSIEQDKGHWYTNAQKILDKNTFAKSKNYKYGNFQYYNKNKLNNEIPEGKDLSGELMQYAHELLGRTKYDPNITYDQVKNKLNQNRDTIDSKTFYPFSEFTAFGVENLNTPWNIKKFKNNEDYDNKDFFNKNHGANLGRKFLKKMIKGTYNNFKSLDDNFRNNYPNVHNAFLDRLTELRNYNKHSDAELFKQNMNSRLNPILNIITTTTSPSTSPSVQSNDFPGQYSDYV